MVFSIARDACAIVVVTVHGPLTVDNRPVLCRAVDDELRLHAARVVVDFGDGELGPVDVSTALRIERMCRGRATACALVTGDRDRLRQALADNAADGYGPVIATNLAAALAPARAAGLPPT
ncbi:hypothetical protein SAMN05414137_12012 [Streptacidiphilus jiangxiensis]|uniref:STAS domain-containing protein n=1 Tax=Streptacidiphilus jiangxiensis TaxID=235985 RepID=A0A1H7W988_STRJI|nr:hypothetical protein [Streptacidiphilus jiangxiensis]SEM18070.1 hypothetical protein SAMN05414137_12012 [Streptacidiphilus jiangxiensis]